MYMKKKIAYWKIEDEYLSIMDSDNEKAALTAYKLSTLSTRKRKYFIKNGVKKLNFLTPFFMGLEKSFGTDKPSRNEV